MTRQKHAFRFSLAKRVCTMGLLAWGGLSGCPAFPDTGSADRRFYSIPEGKAQKTLKMVAVQSEVDLVAMRKITHGVWTRPIEGRFEVMEAFQHLLEGTPLVVVYQSEIDAYTVVKRPPGPSVSDHQNVSTNTETNDNMNEFRKWIKLMFQSAVATGIAASPELASGQDDSGESVYTLSPFEVSAEGDKPYLAANSLSGTRVNLPIERIPTRISVVTEDLFRDVKEFNVDEAVKYAGVRKRGFFGNGFNIRGFTAFTQIDGMSQDSVSAWDNSLVGRIDIAKGPSGVLYGVGSPGGAVNIITKKAIPHETRFIRASTGSRGAFRLETDLGGSLDESGNVAWRLSGAMDKFVPGIAFGKQLKIALMPQVSFRLNDATLVEFQYAFQQIPDMVPWNERFPQLNGTATLPDGSTRTTAISFVPGVPEDFNVDGPDSDRFDQNDMFTAALTHQLNDNTSVKFTYRNTKRTQERRNRFLAVRPSLVDGVLTPNPVPVQIWRSNNDNDRNTLQMDLNHDWRIGESVHGNIVIGGSYDWSDTSNQIFWNRDTAWLAENGFVLDILNPPTDKSDPRHAAQYKIGDFPTDFPGPVWRDDINSSQGASPWAIFNSFFMNDRLNVMGGWRRDYRIRSRTEQFSRVDTDRQSVSFANAQDLDTFMGGASYAILQGSDSTAFDSLTAFANLSQAKNFNGFPFEATPRLGEGVEFGFKASLLEGKLYSTLSYFDLEQSNIPRRDPNFGGDLTLGGLESSTGFDWDVYFFPVEGTTIYFNIIDQDPKVESRPDRAFVEGSITGDGGYKEAWQLAATQKFIEGPLSGVSITFGAIHRGEEKPFGDNPGLFLLTQPAYTTYNLSLSKRFDLRDGKNVTLELFSKNLTDEFYIESNMIIGRARETWAGVSYNF